MAIYRDPVTGLLRSDNSPAQGQQVALPPSEQPGAKARPIEQLPAEPRPSFARRAAGAAGSFAKEVVGFVARPLLAPFAGLSEDVAALGRGENPWTSSRTYRPQTTALSRYAFQNTEPDSKERGYAALSRAVEAGTFLPELLVPGGILARRGASLLNRGLASAAVEAPFGATLGYLDAKRRGEADPLKQAAAGGALAAGISVALPFAGAALRRAVGPFIPSLSRQGTRALREGAEGAAEGALPRSARQAGESAAGPVLPTRTVSMDIPDDVATRVIAKTEDVAQAPEIISALRRGSPDIFDEFGEEVVQKVIKALDDEASGLGTAAQRTVSQNIVARNVARQAAERRAGMASSLPEKIKGTVSKAKAKLVDFSSPVEDVLSKAERDLGMQILPKYDVRDQIDIVLRSPQLAGQFVRDSGLDKVIVEAEKRGGFDELSEYLIAKQNEDIRKIRPDVELGRSQAQDRAIIRGLEEKVGDLALKVNQYSQKLLDTAADGGLVSKEAAERLKKTYPNYVPINRVFSIIEEEGRFLGKGQVASLSDQTIVQSLKGSQRAIQDPLQSIIEKTQDVFVQVERNKAAQMMAMYRHMPGNPFGIVPLRVAENVQERTSIWKALKESKPFKTAMARILSSKKKEMRSLMVELRRLNIKGLKIALKKKATEAPAQKTSGLVDVDAFLKKKGLPKERAALERALSSMRAKASDLRAELAALNAEGYMRGLAREGITLPPRSGTARKIDASLGRKVNVPLLNRVIKKIEDREPKLATQLRGISDAEKQLAAVKDAIRNTTKKEAEEIALVERAMRGKRLVAEEGFAEIPATLSDEETIDFIDSMIKLPDAELASVKRMIANREPKLAAVFKDVENLRGQLGMLNMMRKEAFERGRELADIPVPAGKKVFHVIKDGIKETYAIEPEFADVISTATPLQLGLIEKTLLLPTRILKAGATGLNIPFTLFNLIKDQITGVLNSSKAASTSNPYIFLKALFEAVKHGEGYKQAVRAGAVTTSYALLRNQAALNVSRTRAKASVGNFVAHIVRNPSELLRLPMEGLEGFIGRGEEVRRLQEFFGTKASLMKQGASEETANILAADAARYVTANFYRRGEWGRVLNAAFPYMNAGIQGTRSFFRAMRDNPVQTSAKVASLVMLPFAVTTAWNLKDPKRKLAYDDIPDWEKENNLIIVPPDPQKDENGRWMVYKIPLPPNVGAMVIPIRQTFEAAHGLDPKRFAGLAQALIGSTSPLNIGFGSREETFDSLASTFTPQIIKPGLEAYANKSFFTGAPIVPTQMTQLPTEMQVRPNTSNTAIAIARQLDVSPLKVEAFLKSSGGTVASQVLNALDRATVASGLNPDAQIGGESITSNISRRAFRATGGAREARLYDRANELRTEGRGRNETLQREASDVVDQLGRLSATAGMKLRTDLIQRNPDLAEAVAEEIKDRQLGLTEQDRVIKSLGVEDGARAKYILELEANMTPAEIEKFEMGLRLKKVISNEVYKQIIQSRNKVMLPAR